MKIRARNTGFMRQAFVYFRGKYAGIEFNKRYFRVYKITPEGVLPRFMDLWGATRSRAVKRAIKEKR